MKRMESLLRLVFAFFLTSIALMGSAEIRVMALYEVGQGNVVLTSVSSSGLTGGSPTISNQYVYSPYGMRKKLNHRQTLPSPPRGRGAGGGGHYQNLFNQTRKPLNITYNQFGYTGQIAAPSTSLMMLGGFRNYAPGIGRFIQPDTYNSFSKQHINNSMAYVTGNPVLLTDPDGHHTISNTTSFLGFGWSVLVSGLQGWASTLAETPALLGVVSASNVATSIFMSFMTSELLMRKMTRSDWIQGGITAGVTALIPAFPFLKSTRKLYNMEKSIVRDSLSSEEAWGKVTVSSLSEEASEPDSLHTCPYEGGNSEEDDTYFSYVAPFPGRPLDGVISSDDTMTSATEDDYIVSISSINDDIVESITEDGDISSINKYEEENTKSTGDELFKAWRTKKIAGYRRKVFFVSLPVQPISYLLTAIRTQEEPATQ